MTMTPPFNTQQIINAVASPGNECKTRWRGSAVLTAPLRKLLFLLLARRKREEYLCAGINVLVSTATRDIIKIIHMRHCKVWAFFFFFFFFLHVNAILNELCLT